MFKQLTRKVLWLAASAILTACGGGGGGSGASFTVGVNVTGLLSGESVTLQLNGSNSLTVSSTGAATFTQGVGTNGSYAVTVSSQPAGQVCTVNGGTGAGLTANISNISVTCSTDTYVIGGTVSGLTSGNQVSLTNNSGNATTISANGTFTFSTPVTYNGSYTVLVSGQPTGQMCSVTNGTGSGVVANVANVVVNCSTDTYTIAGTVSGLTTGQQVTLADNGGDHLVVNANGTFTFATPVTYGGSYTVTVGTQPTTEMCSVSNATGTSVHSNISNIQVSCSLDTYTIGGTVSGLTTGQQVTLLNNGGDATTVTGNGTFTFPTPVVYGGTYAATVGTQPTTENCTVTNGTGSSVSAAINNIGVSCSVVPYFSEVVNAFPSMDYMYMFSDSNIPVVQGSAAAAAADLLGDGKKELVIAVSKEWNQQLEVNPAQSMLYIFKLNNQNQFVDVTAQWIPNNPIIQGKVGYGEIKFIDLNNDGKPDIIVPVNQDDGRQGGNGSVLSAQSVVFMSQPNGTYSQYMFGLSNQYAFGVEVGYDYSGTPFLSPWPNIGPLYQWSGSALTVAPFSLSGAQTEGTFLNLASATYSNGYISTDYWRDPLGVDGFVSSGNNVWSSIGTFTFGNSPTVGSVSYVDWTGAFSTVNVIQVNGQYVTQGHLNADCALKPTPTSDPIVLFTWWQSLVKNYSPGATVSSSDFVNMGSIVGVRIQTNQLIDATPVINGQVTLNLNYWNSDLMCADVNGDGYQDIVIKPLVQGTADASPIVYLNNKNGQFTRSNYYQNQSIASSVYIDQEASVMADFDGDGIPDIVIYGSNPSMGQVTGTAKFYKGTKLIDK